MPSTTRKKRQRRKISPLLCVLGIALSFVIDQSESARSSNSNSINSSPQQPRSSSWGRSNKGKRLSSPIESSESSSSDSDFIDLDAEKQLLEDFFQKKIFDSSEDADDISVEREGEDDTDTDESLMRNVFRQVDEHDGEEEGVHLVEEEEGEYSAESEKEALYDAYNLLHTLAQDFQKPFDAPAVLVVGHQSSGKSALIEALMGFQFNSVGGGTKTRRPISLRMQYNPKCHSPKCFLLEEDGIERPKSLSEIQAYIDRENLRLQRDPVRNFDPREIQIRMEYKYCPNMILIDTPGLIQSNRPGRSSTKNNAAAASSSVHNNLQQKILYQSAREVERLVINKMKTQEYIILCVEDTNDWKADCRTREIVQKVDPDLSRTVIVNTKLDTKVPQFGSPKDLSDFIKADIVDGISPQKLGGPFFTSVPSGRVYREGQNQLRSSSSSSSLLYGVDDTYDSSGSGSVPTDVTSGTAHEDDSSLESSEFLNDDDFVQACAENEEHDRTLVRKKLKKIPGNRMAHKELMPRVGLSRLRQFLETKVDECYRRNVCKIVPLLENEYITASKRLEQLEQDLEALSVEKLKHSADMFCDEFCQAVKEAIQGSVAAPASLFGETLEQENLATGSFYDIPGSPMALSYRAWDNLVNTQVGNREHKLYGGSQYHRVLREFNLAARCLRLPVITEDEIANAAGVGDRHDGVNFLRASCVIAIEKARISFDPLLDALKIRMCHVMSKLCPISEYMLRQKRERSTGTLIDAYSYSSSTGIGASGVSSTHHSLEQNPMTDITQNPQFKQLVRSIFDKFVDQCSDSAMLRCRDDLMSLTKFVTWDLHQTGSRGSLRRSLPGQTDMVSVYKVAIEAAQREEKQPPLSSSSSSSKGNRKGGKNNNNNNQDLNMEHHGDHEIHHHPQHHHDHHSYHQYPHHQQELVVRNQGGADDRDYYNLLQLMEETVLHRDANRTTILVSGLVQHIVGQWRETFGNSVTTKFNCFFLMPFVDEFHRFLRTELQHVYDSTSGTAASSAAAAAEMSEVFDLSAARKALGQRVEDLREECEANRMLRHKFDQVYKMMQSSQLLLEEENKQQMRKQQENNGVVESALLTRKQTSSSTRGESSSHSKNNG